MIRQFTFLARAAGMTGSGVIAVVGATGLQGRAVTRALLEEGWHVRALTRDPAGRKVRSTPPEVEVVRADANDPGSLERAFEGAHGVYSVQNHHVSGYDGEIRQGRNVTDAALRTAVDHVVYGAAGPGRQRTGVGSWETKVTVAEYMRQRELPVTILRPMAFMELMTASKFFPAASTWHVMPQVMGSSRPVGWLAVEDLGAIVAKVFADPGRFLGTDLPLTADVQSIEECRRMWQEMAGRSPRRLPMPLRLFERFVGTDETTMWRWLRSNEIDLDTRPTLDVHPQALTVRSWLSRRIARTPEAAGARHRAEGAV